jgi:hypothetical protein
MLVQWDGSVSPGSCGDYRRKWTMGGIRMPRKTAIGIQDFGDIITKNCFYVDKTGFIKEWWENGDSV